MLHQWTFPQTLGHPNRLYQALSLPAHLSFLPILPPKAHLIQHPVARVGLRCLNISALCLLYAIFPPSAATHKRFQPRMHPSQVLNEYLLNQVRRFELSPRLYQFHLFIYFQYPEANVAAVASEVWSHVEVRLVSSFENFSFTCIGRLLRYPNDVDRCRTCSVFTHHRYPWSATHSSHDASVLFLISDLQAWHPS